MNENEIEITDLKFDDVVYSTFHQNPCIIRGINYASSEVPYYKISDCIYNKFGYILRSSLFIDRKTSFLYSIIRDTNL